MLNLVSKYFIPIMLSLYVGLFGIILFAVIYYNTGPGLLHPPFDFLPNEQGLVEENGYPVYTTNKDIYYRDENIVYEFVAVVQNIPFELRVNRTLVTADRYIDVCQFTGPNEYPRNLTTNLGVELTIPTYRELAYCFPNDYPDGKYRVETVLSVDGAVASVYLTEEFEIRTKPTN